MTINNIKLITFDVTNTLLKFRAPPGQQYARIGLKYGFETDEREVANEFKKQYKRLSKTYPNFGYKSQLSWEEWWMQVVKSTLQNYVKDEEKLSLIAKSLIEEYKMRDSWILTEGSIDLLEYLIHNKILLGVLSNFDPRLHTILKNMEIKPYFNFILPSYEAGCLKPDSRIFEEALRMSKIEKIQPYHAIHIGDNFELDYKGAQRAGWKSILINKNIKQNINPNHAFTNLSELYQAIVNETLKL